MKQEDIDSFRSLKASLADSMKRLQNGLYEIHSEYDALLKRFKCDHKNGDESTAFKPLNPYADLCGICNKTEPKPQTRFTAPLIANYNVDDGSTAVMNPSDVWREDE